MTRLVLSAVVLGPSGAVGVVNPTPELDRKQLVCGNGFATESELEFMGLGQGIGPPCAGSGWKSLGVFVAYQSDEVGAESEVQFAEGATEERMSTSGGGQRVVKENKLILS